MGTVMLAIKMGSSTTTIYREKEGFLLKEPSLVAITGSVKGKEVCAVGFEAKRLQGRTATDGVTSVVAPIYERWSLRKQKPLYFTPYAVAVLDSNGIFSRKAAADTFGYKPRSLQSTIRDTVLWLKGSANGHG